MKNVKDCKDEIKVKDSETRDATYMKQVLCSLGQKLGFYVDIEEKPASELGALGIRHDVLWYTKPPDWYKQLLEIVSRRNDLELEYLKLIKERRKLDRFLQVAFEIEATDLTTKAMKGDISNLSKLPYGIIVVKRGRENNNVEPVRHRFEKALLEFRKLHGPNNVLIVSFEDVERLFNEISG
ncbi:MAG: hypothetical protein ACUVUF_05710 [Candidatus Bathycorpusculaceae bacterium]